MANGGDVTLDAEDFMAALMALAPPRLHRPVALALVDTAKSAISRAGSLIAKRTGLKSKLVRSRIKYDTVAVGDYQVVIRSSRRAIALADFPSVRQTAAGVSVKVWGKPQIIQGAFLAGMRGGRQSAAPDILSSGGHRGVFRRVGRSRLPIEKLWGPTIAGTFAQPEVQAVVQGVAKARLKATLLRRIGAEIRRGGR